MKNQTLLRVTLDVIIFLLVISGWWFIALPLAIVGAWVFPRFAELAIAGFAYDALFGIGRGLGIMGYAGIILSAILLGSISYLKAAVRSNS